MTDYLMADRYCEREHCARVAKEYLDLERLPRYDEDNLIGPDLCDLWEGEPVTVIHVDFNRREVRDLCVHCGKPCVDQFDLPSGLWHWNCWREAHPPTATKPAHQIDTAYLRDDPDDGTRKGWYAIIRMGMGADLWCGPHETETRAVDAAKKKARTL